MTERLYYRDAYITDFEATVDRVEQRDEGYWVQLDRSYFYPTSGGQQHDTGTIDSTEVVDVRLTETGDVEHLLADSVDAGQTVRCKIDWSRRFDHMQQHTGQHLLSQAFLQTLEIESVSVHFSSDYSTLDVDAPRLSQEDLARVQVRANEIIWSNRPVHTYWVDEAEIESVPLRRPPKVSGAIRIVEIDGYDWTACGGTHVRRTGEIGPIALVKAERLRQQTRVTFLCGGRVLTDYHRRYRLLDETAGLLDTAHDEVPGLVAKLQERLRDADRALRTQIEMRLAQQAKELLHAADVIENARGTVRVVARALPELDPGELRTLVHELIDETDVVALLACAGGERGTAIFARSATVNLDASTLLRTVVKKFGGGGGGGADFAQGGGMPSSVISEMIAFAAQQASVELATMDHSRTD